ncbi:MAG: polyphosphate kinase 1 [Acidimicrobiales bacterium]|jgi:polyphosphate kinase
MSEPTLAPDGSLRDTPTVGEPRPAVLPEAVATGAVAVTVRRPPGGRNPPERASAPGGPSGEVLTAELAASPERFSNRELSWLEFASRLLDLAADDRQPLLERVKFLAIFTEGLDEFFQVRVAGLEDQVAAGLRARSPDGSSPGEQLRAITGRVTALFDRQSRIFADQVHPALTAAGLLLVDWHRLGEADRLYLDEVYERTIFPILTPLAVDPGHPFPYISNLCLNLVARVVDPGTDEQRIARVKVPPLLPRFVALPDGRRLVPVEQVIAAHLDSLFPAMAVAEHHVFRVTRNADLSVDEDDAHDLLAAVELELHRRRFGQAVRLEVSAGISTELLDMLVTEVDVPEDNVFLADVPIDLGGLRVLAEVDRPDLAPEPWTPLVPNRLAGDSDLFATLREGDVLLHHPYESFAASVEAFVERAASDPDVMAIKQTLYRTGTDSPIVGSLIKASQSGKQVTAVVELQARFDERANIAWARALEEAGVQVVYGLRRIKTHCKMSLVIRREGDHTRRYCHVGSGNYNSITARTYEDIGLLTADPDIGSDVAGVFNLLTGSGSEVSFRRLVVSPLSTRAEVIAAIDAEGAAGWSGRIVIKTNGLTDPEVIDALYRASAAGASVDLIVRGRCCIRAGVPGLSENIRVRSIVGRFLEHSRIFRFGGDHGRPLRIFFGSPDMMERNLDRRVEVIVPVQDPEIQQRLVVILDEALRDQANSWTLGADGIWVRSAVPVAEGPGFSLQDQCRTRALVALEDRRVAARSVPSLRVPRPADGPGGSLSKPEGSEGSVGPPEPYGPQEPEESRGLEEPSGPPPTKVRWWRRLFGRTR